MLTDARCRSESCPEGRDRVRLTDAGSLYLEITPASKRWYWKYSYAGKEKRIALGAYPDVTIKQARLARDDARRTLANGKDPLQVRQDEKIARRIALGSTFEAVARNWFEHWKDTQSERHARYVMTRLESDAFPEFGNRPITEISAPHLVAMARKIESRGAAYLARRTLQSVSQVFRYAVAHGILERNPAADFRPADALKRHKTKNYARLDARDVPELLRKMEGYVGSAHTRFAMKLMALTFVRTGELIGAKWDEFEHLNSAEPTWRIPAERMKMDVEHIVPLSRQAIEVLACLNEIRTKSEYVFPGERNRKGPMSNNTILFALYRMGYRGRMTGHGFRGIASTLLHELGWRHDLIEIQLAHSERNEVSAAYNHAQYLVERRKLMQAWADHLDVLRNERKVVAFRAGKAH